MSLAVSRVSAHWRSTRRCPLPPLPPALPLPLPLPPHPTLPRLLVLIASHLSTPSRLHALLRTLASVASQSHPPSRVLLGWSAATPRLREEAQRRLAAARQRLPSLELCAHAACSQFEHYRSTCAEAMRRERADAFVVLSDDDDLWHRVESYAIALQRMSGTPEVSAVCCPVIAQPARRGQRVVALQAEVDAMLASGEAERLSDCREYFCFCARLATVRQFFEQTCDAVVRSRYCDLRFANFCDGRVRPEAVTALVEPVAGCWMYFYSTRQFNGAEQKTLDPFDADERSAYASSEQAVVQLRTTSADEARSREFAARQQWLGAVDLGALATVVASLRMNAEVFAVQMRGAGWAWDERATSEAAQAVMRQLLTECVEQVSDFSAAQLRSVREVLIPELAQEAAQIYT